MIAMPAWRTSVTGDAKRGKGHSPGESTIACVRDGGAYARIATRAIAVVMLFELPLYTAFGLYLLVISAKP